MKTTQWLEEIIESRYQSVAVRVSEKFLSERRTENRAIWEDAKNWKFGHYFGRDDTRLWVPRRRRTGEPDPNQNVINFAHPLGQKAFRILALGYGIAAIAVVTVGAIAFGARW
ncbi:MAG TPA: hypothetical protein PKY51_11785 [Fimbriimonadaceae bacterium]|nr:hypothetical protein [Fimbriimonadaceae bacterium]